jgi:hypothetical protein
MGRGGLSVPASKNDVDLWLNGSGLDEGIEWGGYGFECIYTT